MAKTIFFSWQSDTPNNVGRNFVSNILKKVIEDITFDTSIDEALRDGLEIDHDTKGVPGTPPIVETIFKKIDEASAFVGDLTFTGNRPNGDPVPNPNVLIEYGWALKSLTHSKIILIMNTAYGDPNIDQMPFDLKHFRRPIQFYFPEHADLETRNKAKVTLERALAEALRTIISTTPTIVLKPEEFIGRPTTLMGHFSGSGQPLGILDLHSMMGTNQEILLKKGHTTWLRLMPYYSQGKTWSYKELKKACWDNQNQIFPLYSQNATGFNYLRRIDGFGVFNTSEFVRGETDSIVMGFNTGEIWAIDTYMIDQNRLGGSYIYLPEQEFAKSFDEFIKALIRLGVQGPYRWIIGMEGIKDLRIHIPIESNPYSSTRKSGPCLAEFVEEIGIYNIGENPKILLKPFFEKIYDYCGAIRPEWLDKST